MKRINHAALLDMVSGTLILLLGTGGLLWLIDANIRIVRGFGEDARLYPQVLSVLMIIVGVSIAFGGIRKWTSPSPEISLTVSGVARVAGAVFSVAAFAFIAPRTGFLPAAILAVAAFALGTGVRKPLPLLALSVGTALTIYFVAAKLLGLSLPG